MDINWKQLGQDLRAKRKELRLIQRHIAYDLGITDVQYGKYERGMDKIGLANYIKICDILKINNPVEFIKWK